MEKLEDPNPGVRVRQGMKRLNKEHWKSKSVQILYLANYTFCFVYYWNVIVVDSREIDWSTVPGTSAYLGQEATFTNESKLLDYD